ncbi:MAG: helix-turn-helix transcriptional regulator [Chloroflexi bacterium]|nr:helix-turn-helix transcriptional regulator [Chloroflexota bacterium]MYC48393.1 helix-turn-helix transcriptional regulator [Chloroflexota bacterium]
MPEEKFASGVLRANLRKVRELRGMTQAQVGDRASIGAASISHFETGQRTPTVETLVKLADALDVNVDTLLGRTSIATAAQVDPVFLSASRADSRTLETIRQVASAILSEASESADSGLDVQGLRGSVPEPASFGSSVGQAKANIDSAPSTSEVQLLGTRDSGTELIDSGGILGRARQTVKPIVNREKANSVVDEEILNLKLKSG